MSGLSLPELFTTEALRAIVIAQGEARLLGHSLVTPLHVLLGLLARQPGLDAGITIGELRDLLRGLTSPEEPDDVKFSEQTRRVLDRACVGAGRSGHRRVTARDLLVAVLDDRDRFCDGAPTAAVPVSSF